MLPAHNGGKRVRQRVRWWRGVVKVLFVLDNAAKFHEAAALVAPLHFSVKVPQLWQNSCNKLYLVFTLGLSHLFSHAYWSFKLWGCALTGTS